MRYKLRNTRDLRLMNIAIRFWMKLAEMPFVASSSWSWYPISRAIELPTAPTERDSCRTPVSQIHPYSKFTLCEWSRESERGIWWGLSFESRHENQPALSSAGGLNLTPSPGGPFISFYFSTWAISGQSRSRRIFQLLPPFIPVVY